MSTCKQCAGYGKVMYLCPKCSGSGEGYTDGSMCTKCFGRGVIEVSCLCKEEDTDEDM